MDEFLIGSCELQLNRLHFVTGREPKEVAIRKLVELFKLSCDPAEYYIPVVVSPDELQIILNESNVRMEDIVRRHIPLPRLTPSAKLRSIHGRQRYEAAIRVFGLDMWWAVRLYCIPAGSDVHQLLPQEIDQSYYQTSPSDGEVFLKVRGYEDSGRHHWAAMWRLRLSACKQVALRAVERQGQLLEALDQLRAFPGLWGGFQLGNMQRCIALHATEEVLHYLQHVYNIWGRITLYDPAIQQATDLTTVRGLELRVPAASSIDGNIVRELIESGHLFRNIRDPAVRNRLEHAILQVSVLIPSIRTFHENMKLLTIGMTILRDHIIDELGGRSVRAAMAACWEPPEKCIVEYQDDAFYELDFRPTAEISYRQVVMAALRHFPRLSAVPPRCERGQKALTAAVDNVYLASFLRGVRKQGFRSRKLATAITRLGACPVLRAPAISQVPFTELTTNRRCGRPFARSHSFLGRWFFLPNVLFAHRHASQPCALFVQEDFMCSFFGQQAIMMQSLSTALRQRQQAQVTHGDTGSAGIQSLAEAEGPIGVSASSSPRHMANLVMEDASEIPLSPEAHSLPSQCGGTTIMEDHSFGRTNSQSVPSNLVSHHSSFASSRSLLRPQGPSHHNEPQGRTYLPPHSQRVPEQRGSRDRTFVESEFWSPLQSSQGTRSIYSPQQWFTSIRQASQPTREPAEIQSHLYSPERSLPSSGTSFSSRSLILPEELRDLRQTHLGRTFHYDGRHGG